MNSLGLLQSLILQETRSIQDSMKRPKLNLLLILAFYDKYLKYYKIFIIKELKQFCMQYEIVVTVLSEYKLEKWNSQLIMLDSFGQ